MKHKLLAVILLIMLQGCGGSDSNEASPENATEEKTVQSIENADDLMEALRKNGDIPTLDRSDSLAGPDSNSNGVRDDIDEYIYSLSLDGNRKEIVVNLAKAFQRIQSENILTEEVAGSISLDSRSAVSCFVKNFYSSTYSSDGSRNIFKRIQAYTANTYKRAERVNEYNTLRDGTVVRSPRNINC